LLPPDLVRTRLPSPPALPQSRGRDPEIDPPWKYPQAALAAAVLRVLMARAEGNALFRRRPDGDPSPNSDSPYRATAFWPVEQHDGYTLYPFLRYRYGESLQPCDSALSFAHGERFAGEAWRCIGNLEIGELIVDDDLPSLEDCGNDRATWHAQWIAKRVPESIAYRMGHGSRYAEQVRSLACIGVRSSYGPIVFVIDSVRKNAFAEQYLTDRAKKLTDQQPNNRLKVLLRCVLRSRVTGHKDYWMWLSEQAARRRTRLSILLGVFTGLVGLLRFLPTSFKQGVEAAVATSAFAFLPSVTLGLSALVLLILSAIGMMPQEDDLAGNRDIRKRSELYMRRWSAAWLTWVTSIALSAVAAAVQASHLGKHGFPYLASNVLAALFAIFSAYWILGTYFCIDRFMRSRSGRTPVDIPGQVTTAFVGIGILAAVLNAWPAAAPLGQCLVAVMSAVSLCLLVGRLDSRLVGAPGIVIAALYAGAILHGLCAFASEPIASLLCGLRLPLDVLLFSVVLWTVQGRALERYLTYVTEVASNVPRTSYSDVFIGAAAGAANRDSFRPAPLE
jgi:hypothetical protein